MLRSKNGKWGGGCCGRKPMEEERGVRQSGRRRVVVQEKKRRRDKDQMRHAGRLRNGVREMLFQAHT